jgi:choline-sulfatase
MFMLRRGQYKYVYYPDNPDQLFDLDADPNETRNLASAPEHETLRAEFEAELGEIVDPDAVDRRAHRDQERRLAELTSDADEDGKA